MINWQTDILSLPKIITSLGYRSTTNVNKSPSELTAYTNLIEIIIRFSSALDDSFENKYVRPTALQTFVGRIWKSFTIDYSNHFDTLSALGYHKQIQPTSFDNWSHLDFQTYLAKFNEHAEIESKKNVEAEENSKVTQNDMMSNASKMTRTKQPKIATPRMSLPKMK